MGNKERENLPKFEVIYCENNEELLNADRYIEFIKHLVNVFKEQNALNN